MARFVTRARVVTVSSNIVSRGVPCTTYLFRRPECWPPRRRTRRLRRPSQARWRALTRSPQLFVGRHSQCCSARAMLSLLRRRHGESCRRKSSRGRSALNRFTAIIVRAASVGVSLVTGKAGAAKSVQWCRRATVEQGSFIFPGAPRSSGVLLGGSHRGPGLTGERYTGGGCAIVRTHPKV